MALSIIQTKSDELQDSTVVTAFLPIERSAHISECVYTYCSSILEEAHLQKNCTYTYGYTTQAMNTYGGGSLYEPSTLTTTNSSTSKVHTGRRQHTIEPQSPLRTSAQAKCTYGVDTL